MNYVLRDAMMPSAKTNIFKYSNFEKIFFAIIVSSFIYIFLKIIIFNISVFIRNILMNNDTSSKSYIIMSNLKELLLPVVAILISILALLLR